MTVGFTPLRDFGDGHWYALRVATGALQLRHPTTERWRRKVAVPAGISIPAEGFPIEQIMARRGYKPFIPVENIFIRKNRFHPREKKRVKRAILPGMVFLRLAGNVNWYSILQMPMITGVFGIGGRPYRFDDAAVEKLIAISADARQPDFYKPMPTRRGYNVGDKVVDLGGLIEGEIEVVEINGNVAKVLVPFFGDLRRVTAQASNLAKVGG